MNQESSLSDQVIIYILLSIKTRIETDLSAWRLVGKPIFISYYPLKQGLKRINSAADAVPLVYLYPTIH